jgi:hypothetical protein
MPGSQWLSNEEQTTLRLTKQPSWLLKSSILLRTFMEAFYTDPQWATCSAVEIEGGLVRISGCDTWAGEIGELGKFIHVNGIAKTCWINATAVCSMLGHYST